MLIRVGGWTREGGPNFSEDIVWLNGRNSTNFVPSDRTLSYGDIECQCINPWVNVNEDSVDCPRNGTVFDDNASGGSTSVCFPATYGAVGCNEYDQFLHPDCIGSDPDPKCSRKWCFVDPNNCLRDPKLSDTRFLSATDLHVSKYIIYLIYIC